MGAIEEIYTDVEADVSEEEFRAAVQEKVEQMGGLADEETAAMLIAHELADQEVNGIAEIEPGMEEVKFVGQVLSVGELRTFERDDDEDGQVINVEVADETGRIRVAFWDEMANAAADQLEPGVGLRLKGRPNEGYDGVEVNADKVEIDEAVDIDVAVTDEYSVEELSLGSSDVTLAGRVLATEPVRTFDRDDGSEGQVRNVRLQDDTGDIRVALWGEKADLDLAPGDEVQFTDVEIQDGWQDDLEASAGWRSTVTKLDEGEAQLDVSVEAEPPSGGVDDATSGSDDELGLDAFAASDGDGAAAEPSADSSEDAGLPDGEPIEFTGVVVQAGEPVVLDDGERTVTVDTEADVELGQEVTVSGPHREGRIDAEDVR